MNTSMDLKQAAEQAKTQGHAALILNGASCQLYDGKVLQFNVTLAGRRFPTIKFEERSPGRFTVAVAPEDGASIDYTKAKVFTMDEPIEHLAAAFPLSEDMGQFVYSLTCAD